MDSQSESRVLTVWYGQVTTHISISSPAPSSPNAETSWFLDNGALIFLGY